MNFTASPLESRRINKAKSLLPWSLLSKGVQTEDKQVNGHTSRCGEVLERKIKEEEGHVRVH